MPAKSPNDNSPKNVWLKIYDVFVEVTVTDCPLLEDISVSPGVPETKTLTPKKSENLALVNI